LTVNNVSNASEFGDSKKFQHLVLGSATPFYVGGHLSSDDDLLCSTIPPCGAEEFQKF
jgi:hypothetical protein